MKILILTCATGEGHNGAARAIGEKLDELNIPFEICDPLSFKSDRAPKRASDVYARTVKYTPLLFGCAYAMGAVYDCTRLPNPVYRSNAKCADGLYNHIKNGGFDCVICTHLFAMQAITAMNKKFGCRIPCYGILTDYTAIPFYRTTLLDGYFVTHSKVKQMLTCKGIAPEKIYLTGIPVSEKACNAVNKSSAREQLNIPEDNKMIAVLSGGAGCGKIVALCRRLVKEFGSGTEIYAFPAKNLKLKKRLERKFASTENVKIIPFTPNLPTYIAGADVVLTKAGGLSSTEIAVAGVPIVHTKSIPGCETYNRRYFATNGMSVYSPTVRGAVKKARKLLEDGNAAQSMSERQHTLIDPHAADNIIAKIADKATNEAAFKICTEARYDDEGLFIGQEEVTEGATL